MSGPTIVFAVNSMFAVRHLLPQSLTAATRRGFRVAVIAPGPKVDDVCDGDGNRVQFVPVPLSREISVLADLLSLWAIWCVLRSLKPSVVDASTPKMGLLGGLAAVLAGVPHRIYTIRGLRYEGAAGWKRRLLIACEKIACACAHQVICISRSVKEMALRDGLTSAREVLLLGDRVSEGIDISRTHRCAAPGINQLRARAAIPDGTAVIGFVGRLTKDKGIQELVECFRILRRQNRAVRLLVVGDFEDGDPVGAEFAEFIRFSPDVHWLGYVADPGPCYSLMDVFVFPTYREGRSGVLLEAAAAGKPVVSTYSTGVIDVVDDGVTGLLVPPRDPAALARATATLLDDREMAARMGRCARAMVERHFDQRIYVARLGATLHAMVHGEPLPRTSDLATTLQQDH